MVIYALGKDLSTNAVKKFMVNVRNFVSMSELFYNEERYIIIRFISKSDKDFIMMRGCYTIYQKLVFLHEWTLDFKMKDDILRVLPEISALTTHANTSVSATHDVKTNAITFGNRTDTSN